MRIAALVVCAFVGACTMWQVAPLEPQRFTAERSPARVRLTMNDSTQVNARHPVIVADSLVWTEDSVRRAVPLSRIRQIEVHGSDQTATFILFALAIAAVAAFISVLPSLGD